MKNNAANINKDIFPDGFKLDMTQENMKDFNIHVKFDALEESILETGTVISCLFEFFKPTYLHLYLFF